MECGVILARSEKNINGKLVYRVAACSRCAKKEYELGYKQGEQAGLTTGFDLGFFDEGFKDVYSYNAPSSIVLEG